MKKDECNQSLYEILTESIPRLFEYTCIHIMCWKILPVIIMIVSFMTITLHNQLWSLANDTQVIE